MSDTNSSPCIGRLEHHVHEIFASVRIPGEDFVYSLSSDLFNVLEDYCDDQRIDESRPALLVLGEPGTGKSALISNWLQRRQRNSSRARNADEFIFWHAVGCSRQSTNVNSLMRRLMNDLKARFELSREVSQSQERLSWDLPRFLDLASKRGKIILVIDGLHRLVSQDGEAGLNWLPLHFPPNVRVVLTASVGKSVEETINDTPIMSVSDVSPKRPRILVELERRHWQVLRLQPLDKPQIRKVVDLCVRKSVQSEASVCHISSDPFLTSLADDTTGSPSRGHHGNHDSSDIELSGILLFDSHIDKIISHNQTAFPLFLRLFLRSLGWAINRGYDLWSLVEDWLSSDSSEVLLMKILQTLEVGHETSSEKRTRCEEYCAEQGGMAALKILYPWHPFFQKESSKTMDLINNGDDFSGGGARKVSGAGVGNNHPSNTNVLSSAQSGTAPHPANNTVSGSTFITMGDQRWMSASEVADKALEDTQLQAQHNMLDMVQRAKQEARRGGEKKSFIDMLLQSTGGTAAAAASAASPTPWSGHHHNSRGGGERDSVTAGGVSVSDLGTRVGAFASVVHNDSDSSLGGRSGGRTNTNHLPHRSAAVNGSQEEARGGGESEEDEEYYEDDNFDSEGDGDEDDDRVPQLSDPSAREGHLLPPSSSSSQLAHSNSNHVQPQPPSHGYTNNYSTSRGGGVSGSRDMMRSTDSSDDYSRTSRVIDPRADLYSLPIYLRGGHDSAGFGSLLGQALALLLVARHGLTESELWCLLATMQESENMSYADRAKREGGGAEIRALIAVCYGYREHFLDIWRTSDPQHTGKLPRSQILFGMNKINPEFTKADVNNLLDTLSLSDDNKVDYYDLIKRIVRKEKSYRLSQLQATTKKGPPTAAGVEGGGGAGGSNMNGLNTMSGTSNPWDSLDLGGGGNGVEDITVTCSLGPVMEEALLSALCALGVLHSPENQVLVLPLESEILRKVVSERYIGKSGSDSWHRRLIRYFQAQSNSLRRSEELPWHLQICRKWHTLKDTLADLSTFEMMFQGELREELLLYWKLLTEGPLYTSDEAHQEASGSSLQQLSNESSRIVSELDTASALGMTEKEARKHLLKNQVAAFDVVEEYNKSIEAWVAGGHISTDRLAEVLALISSFLVAFSRRPDHFPPPFIRLPLDVAELESIGVTYAEFGGVSMSGPTLGGIPKKKLKERSAFGGLAEVPRQDAQLYHYLRWLWVQFPWMALQSAGQVKRESNKSVTDMDVSVAGMSMDDNNNNKGMMSTSITQNSLLITPSRSGRQSPPTASDSLRREYMHAKRFWAIRKKDPYTGPVVKCTPTRLRAAVKSSILSSSISCEALGQAAISSQEASVVLKKQSKFRMELMEEVEAKKNIPFARPTLKSIKSNTRFPSAKSLLKEKISKEENQKDVFSLTAPARFGGQEPIWDLKEELERINEIEILADENNRRAQAMPSISESESLYSLEMDRVSRLRNVYDRMKLDRVARKKTLLAMKEKVDDREEGDEKVAASLMLGEMAIQGLETRHQSMMDALDDAKALNANYTKLLAFLANNPPHTSLHVSAVEQQLGLTRSQLSDLCQFRLTLYSDIERLEHVKRKHLQERIQAIQDQRTLLRNKIQSQRKICNELKVKLNGSVQSLSDNVDIENSVEVASESVLSVANTLSAASKRVQLNRTMAVHSPLIAATRSIMKDSDHLNHDSLNDYSGDIDIKTSSRSAFENLLQKTGVSSVDELLVRYRTAQRLHDSLRSHQNLGEARLANLRAEFNELSVAWGEAQLISSTDDSLSEHTSPSEREARYLDQRLFKAEMKSSQLLRLSEKAVLGINEIRTGVVHMADLIHANESLMKKLPGNSAPPKYAAEEDIAKILSWCEERVIAINEALVLDSTKPVTTDDSQPLHARQTELASLVLAMMKKGSAPVTSADKKKKTKRRKLKGGMSQSLIIAANDSAGAMAGMMLGGVRVAAREVGEKTYEEMVEQDQVNRDKAAAQADLVAQRQSKQDPAEGLHRYLSEALSTNDTKHALRKANHIEGRSLGRNAGFGWAIEEVLDKDVTWSGHNNAAALGGVRTKKAVLADSEEIPDRIDIKNAKISKSFADRRNNISGVSGGKADGSDSIAAIRASEDELMSLQT